MCLNCGKRKKQILILSEFFHFPRDKLITISLRFSILIVFLSLFLSHVYPFAQKPEKLIPPPSELILKSESSSTLDISYGKCSVIESWQAKRVDYNWTSIKKKYQDFYDWYEETREKLEANFSSTPWGTEKISAARDFFDFALEADEKKSSLNLKIFIPGSGRERPKSKSTQLRLLLEPRSRILLLKYHS